MSIGPYIRFLKFATVANSKLPQVQNFRLTFTGYTVTLHYHFYRNILNPGDTCAAALMF